MASETHITDSRVLLTYRALVVSCEGGCEGAIDRVYNKLGTQPSA